MIEGFRVSKRGRDQLVTLKRRTGVENWNVLCRWAFCLSLAEPNPPRSERIPADSSVELTWHTFASEYEGVYLAALKQRCKQEGLDLSKRSLATQFRRHLHRGLGYLAGDPNLTDISGLVSRAAATS
ncbi:MAG: DNA sulfur modification protein DndE [Planctomycetes bacterium]|nr:DNA sulfur modification protein DndE [Planctomycetota bacterium]